VLDPGVDESNNYAVTYAADVNEDDSNECVVTYTADEIPGV
jgi:hypothetical protein